MRRKLLAIRRVAFGPRPLFALTVAFVAAATTVLKSSGFEEWCFNQAMRRGP